METYVKRWGNSLALRIPRPLAKEAGLRENSAVELLLQEGRLIVVPIVEPRYALEVLLAQVTSENLHGEVDTGKAAGSEMW
jgi:antitoxin MazE